MIVRFGILLLLMWIAVVTTLEFTVTAIEKREQTTEAIQFYTRFLK